MRLKKSLLETKFVAKAEDIPSIKSKMGKDDVVRIVDEGPESGDLPQKKSLNNPKIEKFVNGINELIASAIDSDGDPIPVVDRSGTWEEPYIYYPIEYKNGNLKITSKSVYKNEPEVEVIARRNMEFDGRETLLLIKRMYNAAIKRNNKVKPTVEEGNNNNDMYPIEKLYTLAKKAGDIVSDAEDALLHLYMVYSEQKVVPKAKIMAILKNYDIKISELNKMAKPKFRPNPEFAHLFNSSVKEDEMGSASRSIEYGQKEPELGDEDWKELYSTLQQNGAIKEEDSVGVIDTEKLKSDVSKFMDKLDLSQFKNVISKIDKPQEQAEVIAVFAERIGIPRVKLPNIINSLKQISKE